MISDLRLTGHPSSNIGFPQLLDIGRWHAVCLKNANLEQAIVACKHLGFPGAERPVYRKELEEHNQTPKLEIFKCYGHESSLLECHSRFLEPADFEGSKKPCPDQGGLICHAGKLSIECIIISSGLTRPFVRGISCTIFTKVNTQR